MLVEERVRASTDPAGLPVETGISLSVPNGNANWVYYDIALACVLDSGIVVHRSLPQVDRTPDTLSSCDIAARGVEALTGRGVNLVSHDQFTDTVQRMAHSQYWFLLYGQALRVGEQVPIPGLKTIAGVAAVPHDSNPQRAFNRIAGNYSGLVLWHAQWTLWYTLANAPKAQQAPPANLALFVSGDARTPNGMQAPWTQPDDSVTLSLQNPVR